MDESGMRKIVEVLPYGGCPMPGVATAGQPDAGAWSALAAGFKSVVDLREPRSPRGHDKVGEIARRTSLSSVAGEPRVAR